MDKLIIEGGKSLKGEVSIGGAKNAVLPIMAATIIKPAKYTIENVPNLRDTRTMIEILKESGASVSFNKNILQIDSTNCNNPVAPYELVKTMRASFYMLGPFMSRFNKAKVSLPGGCAWGPRPVDFHIKALEKMKASITLQEGNIICEGKLKGANIDFERKSVGATGNVIMAAATAQGKTKISNAACEPEIVDLCNFMKLIGVNISGIGTSDLTIEPNNLSVPDVNYSIIPDRIEAGTFMILALMTKGDIKLNNVAPEHLDNIIVKLKEAGALIEFVDKNSIRVKYNGYIHPVNLETLEYPGFPTDLQAQWMALMTLASGKSKVVENIYRDRFSHVSELMRFGGKIRMDDNVAHIEGNSMLKSAPVMSTDIRASASLILAALSATGKSSISRIYHIDRGYEKIENKIKLLGGKIKRVSS